MSKKLILVNGNRYELNNNFYQLKADYIQENELIKIKLLLTGKNACQLEFRTDNIEALPTRKLQMGEQIELSTKVLRKNCPWLVTILLDGNVEELVELYPGEVNTRRL